MRAYDSLSPRMRRFLQNCVAEYSALQIANDLRKLRNDLLVDDPESAMIAAISRAERVKASNANDDL